MDESLSRLLPSYKIGSDGFQWWIGQVEDKSDKYRKVKGNYRYKVRIVGEHTKSCDIVSKDDLPWAQVLMPVDNPMSAGGKVNGRPHLYVGCWVIGFYMDPDKQKPIIMGAIGQVPGATGVVNEFNPNECQSFTTISPTPPQSDQSNEYEDGSGTVKCGNVESGEISTGEPGQDLTGNDQNDSSTLDGDACKAEVALRIQDDLNAEEICLALPDRCGKEATFGENASILLGDMLAEIQRNDGKIGTTLIHKATGEVGDAVDVARKYIRKMISLVRKFLAKVKGIIIGKLKEAVDALIKAVLRQDDNGNALTPITEFFNKMLKKLGCSIEDIGERIAKFLTDLLMGYVQEIYRNAACQVDLLVSGILNKISSFMDELLGDILGFISKLLGPIADALNLIGSAINKILSLLGITCTGGDRTCANARQLCLQGDEQKKEEEDTKNFLDNLLDGLDESIDDIAPNSGFDNTIYTCNDAYKGRPLKNTNIGFVGGIYKPSSDKNYNEIIYTVSDPKVAEGDVAKFVITRSGNTSKTSSVTYKTRDSDSEDTATANLDYLPKEGIIIFQEGQLLAEVDIFTLTDGDLTENAEKFELVLSNATPGTITDTEALASITFEKNIGVCTIKKRDYTQDPGFTDDDGVKPADPYLPNTQNPLQGLDDFPADDDPEVIGDFDGDGETDDPLAVLYKLTADKNIVKEGEFVVFTIETLNVPNGEIVSWIISGTNITAEDIVGGQLTGTATISANTAVVVVGIADDAKIEIQEKMTFALAGKGIIKDVIIVSQKPSDFFDIGVGDDTPTPDVPVPPTSDTPITDDDGGLIDIPIANPGSPYVEPPYVVISGLGYGATAEALLDTDGFVTEVRVTTPGLGYKLNKPQNTGVRCIIDSFTMIRPGRGYFETPKVYVDGRDDVAEAVIENGRVISVRVLDRETTWSGHPEVYIIGGGGNSAKWIPNFKCLPTAKLAEIGSTKIGTGKYIDCP